MRVIRSLAPVAALGIIVAGITPAHAGTTWGPAQEVSSKLGRSISLSSDGRVAAWIRTNQFSGSGPVRTSYFRSAKKGWTPSAPIVGTAQITSLQISADGNTAFAESPGTGYLMALRTSGNTWGAAATVVSGTQLDFGQMSADTNTIVWVDWTGASGYPAEIPGKVMAQTRIPGGVWGAPAVIGEMPYRYFYDEQSPPLTLSSDGSTVAWIDPTWGLRAATKQADGTFGAAALVKQYPDDPYLDQMSFSADGSTFVYTLGSAEGVLVSTRTAAGWNPVGYVTTDEVRAAVLAPNGTAVGYANEDNQVVVRTWNGVKWAKPTVVGSSGSPAMVMTNKSLAWVASRYSSSTLRVSIYSKGAWRAGTQRSSKAQNPSLSADSLTLAWATTANKRMYSVKR